MENKEIYKLITIFLIAFAMITDFILFMAIMVAFIIMAVFIIPISDIDFSKEYANIMYRNELSEETKMKIIALIFMLFTLISVLHKPMTMLFGN